MKVKRDLRKKIQGMISRTKLRYYVGKDVVKAYLVYYIE